MARISNFRINAHKKAVQMIDDCTHDLDFDDCAFILDAFEPGAAVVADAQTYFTPRAIAESVAIACKPGYRARILDLGAGIGSLSFWFDFTCTLEQHQHGDHEFVCIEKNPRFVEVGRRILPKATWIEGDMFDQNLIESLGKFDTVISNPPFGKLKMERPDWLSYNDRNRAHFMAIEIALRASKLGPYTDDMRAFMVLPQAALPFRVNYQTVKFDGYGMGLDKFTRTHPNVQLNPTSFSCNPADYEEKLFKDTNTRVEIVNVCGRLCTEIDS